MNDAQHDSHAHHRGTAGAPHGAAAPQAVEPCTGDANFGLAVSSYCFRGQTGVDASGGSECGLLLTYDSLGCASAGRRAYPCR